jgi:hypothetical protein
MLDAAAISTQRRGDADVDTNFTNEREFPKPVRAGIVVENGHLGIPSSVRSGIIGEGT